MYVILYITQPPCSLRYQNWPLKKTLMVDRQFLVAYFIVFLSCLLFTSKKTVSSWTLSTHNTAIVLSSVNNLWTTQRIQRVKRWMQIWTVNGSKCHENHYWFSIPNPSFWPACCFPPTYDMLSIICQGLWTNRPFVLALFY